MLSYPRHLEYFELSPGRYPFREWFLGLRDATVRHRIEIRLRKLELGNPGHWRSLGSGLIELKEDFGPGYRLYLAEDQGALVVLLAGGTKRTQARDIALAKSYWILRQANRGR